MVNNSRNINSEKMKLMNSNLVLNCIRLNEPVTRKEISEMVGLTQASVTNIVNDLMQRNYVIETGKQASVVGRKSISLEINSNIMYIVGIELTISAIICVITNFRGRKIYSKRITYDIADHDYKTVINMMIKLIEEAICSSKLNKENIGGIGITSAGPYDFDKEVVVNPPNFIGWFNVPIVDMVEKALGIKTYFETSAVSAAIAEQYFGSANKCESSFIILLTSAGIGGGVIINQKVYKGYRYSAGEIGHVVIDINGPQCKCGGYGCFEAIVNREEIIKKVVTELKWGKDSIIKDMVNSLDEITLDMIFKAVENDDKLCKDVLDIFSRYISTGISNVIASFCPETIILCGDLFNNSPYLVNSSVKYIRQRPYPKHISEIKILPGTFGDEQSALGGVGVVLNKIYGLD